MRSALRRRAGAWILLATFAVALGSSQLSANHFGMVDTACGDVGLASSDGPRVGVAVDVAAEHCPVCHFLRVANRAAIGEVAHVRLQESGVVLGAPAAPAPATRTTPTRCSRGPPAGLSSDIRFS